MNGKKKTEDKRKVEFIFKRIAPQLFFNKVIESIENRELKLRSFDDKWTDIMISYFKKMGEDLGYDVWPEYMRLDCPWMISLPPKLSTIEVAIEYEDSEYLDSVLEEVLKLGHLKAHLKVIVYYPKIEEIEEHLRKIGSYIDSADIKTPDERWLIIVVSRRKNNGKKPEILFQGYERTADGEWEKVGMRGFDEIRTAK